MIPQELLDDLEVLRERGYLIETVERDKKIYSVFRDYPLPHGKYNIEKTDLLIFTTPFYPNSGYDMFWVDEKLLLANGSIPKNGELIEPHLDKQRRRFSYHPYQNKPWNPSEDSVISFFGYIDQRLQNGD